MCGILTSIEATAWTVPIWDRSCSLLTLSYYIQSLVLVFSIKPLPS